MDPSSLICVFLLCLVNVIFMIAGIFLNCVVIISLRRSSQLRKKLCYFMILPLSCFDLAVVAINHPILILNTILWFMDLFNQDERKLIWIISLVTISNLNGFSTSSLLTLSVERFIALRYPFFHETAVTKRRLVLFLTFLVIITVSMSSLLFFDGEIYGTTVIVFVSSFLFLFIYLNYTMHIIAKSKSKDGSITTTHGHQKTKAQKLNFKETSTCLLAVGCFFICSSPAIVGWVLYLTTDTFTNHRRGHMIAIWSRTLFAMNSTLNCLIFFWKNSILRREGMKTVKCFLSARS